MGEPLSLSVTSGSLNIDGTGAQSDLESPAHAEFVTGLLSSTFDGVQAGDLTVSVASGSVSIKAGGQLSAQTNGQGTGGVVTLTIDTGSLTIDGTGAPFSTVDQFYNNPAFSPPLALQTGVFTSTAGADSAGTVYVGASSLSINGTGASGLFAGISSASTLASTTAGSGGDVNLSITGAVSLTDGGKISATTAGGDGSTTGNGGNVYIGVTSDSSDLISADLQDLSSPTSLTVSGAGSAITSATSGLGSAGNVSAVISGSVDLSAGGVISSGATDVGNGSGSGGYDHLFVQLVDDRRNGIGHRDIFQHVGGAPDGRDRQPERGNRGHGEPDCRRAGQSDRRRSDFLEQHEHRDGGLGQPERDVADDQWHEWSGRDRAGGHHATHRHFDLERRAGQRRGLGRYDQSVDFRSDCPQQRRRD